ncbi:hypothetical protein [Rhodoferax ferrireducens]|uniref:hypothetical protein n=1 Tax=Rhodoferax ferrireducens TaxID=192843 RepID=UPI003BB4EA79
MSDPTLHRTHRMLHAWTTPRPASPISPNLAMPTQAYALFPTPIGHCGIAWSGFCGTRDEHHLL